MEEYIKGAGKSPKACQAIPGPGQYSYRNMAIGTDALTCTLKGKITNLQGKASFVSDGNAFV